QLLVCLRPLQSFPTRRSSDLGLEGVFTDYVLSSIYSFLPYLVLYVVFLFFIGIYVGKLLLRPFKNIAEFSQVSLKREQESYRVRSEEQKSELQSRDNLVCRLL